MTEKLRVLTKEQTIVTEHNDPSSQSGKLLEALSSLLRKRNAKAVRLNYVEG